MANVGRKLGVNISVFLQKANISPEIFASKLGYSVKDAWRIIEGKVIVPPIELDRITNILGTTKADLMTYEADYKVPELQYMKEFSNPDNLDKILDLMDEYVECRECV
ncbi:MAG: hypothetical protein KBT48_08305 [Firmicutes bacterium]|nr:hypothetical protein [Bacillota bacterium]SCY46844.1 hypothetical protein SAMN02910370_02708 [Lachnospiraceae bacterium XPB1003]